MQHTQVLSNTQEAFFMQGDSRMDPLEADEEKQTLQDYVFDIREKIPDGVYKILMEKFCYPMAEYRNDEELHECRDFIDLLQHEISALRSNGDGIWQSGYDERRIEEMNKKKDSMRIKYERRKELEQMTPEEKKENIQLRKIDKKIDFETKKVETEENEIGGLQLRINGFANTLIMAHLVNHMVNRIDTNYISLQLRHCELEIKKRRAKIEKSNKLIVVLVHERTRIV
jgi:hypothetical protein